MLIKQNDILQLSELIHDKAGLVFKADKHLDLKNAFDKTLKHFHINDINSFINKLKNSEIRDLELSYLINLLTINETYFYRHFKAIDNYIVPKLIDVAKSSKVKIWSAGCSTGEEPYSICISILEKAPELLEKFSLLATDIDSDVLDKARRGIYKKWSMRQISMDLQRKYFEETDFQKYHVKQKIMDKVDFKKHNLLFYDYPSSLNNTDSLDLILCRNVTIYFDQETTQKIVDHFYRCLKFDGYLLVGHSEPSPFMYEKFEHYIVDDMVIYKKTKKKRHSVIPSIDTSKEERVSTEKTTSSVIRKAAKVQENPLKKVSKKVEVAKTVEKLELKKDNDTDFNEELKNIASKIEKHDYIIAMNDLNKILATDKDNLKANYYMALILSNLHKLEEAIPYCEKAISLDSLNINAYYLLALIFKEQKSYREAVNNLKKAIYIDHNFILAYYELISIYVAVGQKLDAEKNYNIFTKLVKVMDPETEVGLIDNLKVKNIVALVDVLLGK